MKLLTLKIDEALAMRTVGSLMSRELLISDTFTRKLKRRERGIMLNGERAFTTFRVKCGDVLTVDVSDELANRPVPKKADFSVLYEDEDIIIIDKPAGMNAHFHPNSPDADDADGALAYYLPEDIVPHPVSRLDRCTTGAMTFAKSGYVTELLRAELHTDKFKKEYLGITACPPKERAGRIDLPTGFEPGSHLKRAVREDGAPSLSEYEVIREENGLALVRLVPLTGRTHQLRVHMAAIGSPLLGDWLYGEKSELISRPALHSYKLTLTHPLTGETIMVTAPLPGDMAGVIRCVGRPVELFYQL